MAEPTQPQQQPSQPILPQNRILRIMVRNREKVIYDGAAFAVTSVNDKGIFDILPEHINFITMIKNVLTIHKLDGSVQEYKIRTGLMRVSKNFVEIYVGLVPSQTPQK